jgi:hypothetical protein
VRSSSALQAADLRALVSRIRARSELDEDAAIRLVNNEIRRLGPRAPDERRLDADMRVSAALACDALRAFDALLDGRLDVVACLVSTRPDPPAPSMTSDGSERPCLALPRHPADAA